MRHTHYCFLIWLDCRPQLSDEFGNLRIDRLQGAVIVEYGYAFGFRDKTGRALLGHLLDESYDGRLRGSVAPGRQRVGLGQHRRNKEQGGHDAQRRATGQ